MKAYESGSAAYFATPSVNLIYAYRESLVQLTKGSLSLDDRFRLHGEASKQIKAAAHALGLKEVPLDPAAAANGMTAVSVIIIFPWLTLTVNLVMVSTGRESLSNSPIVPQEGCYRCGRPWSIERYVVHRLSEYL